MSYAGSVSCGFFAADLAVGCRYGPDSRNFDQGCLVFLAFGFASQADRFFGVLPEFIGFGHDMLPK
jgi:hypothetical protein